MGWGAWVVTAVRGPLRQVDLFRHHFADFWASWDDWLHKRAWMRVAYRRPHADAAPHAPWWTNPAVALPSPPDVGRGENEPPSLVSLAMKRWVADQRSQGDDPEGSDGLVKGMLRAMVERRLPNDLWWLLTRESLGVRELAQVRQRLLARMALLEADEQGEEVDRKDELRSVREVLMTIDGVIEEECEAELVYNGCIWKRTLEDQIGTIAKDFPQLGIEHLAVPESWAEEMLKVIHYGGEEYSESQQWLQDTFGARSDFAIDEEKDLGGADEFVSDPDGWRSFSFDVTDYDFEYEWGLSEPCTCEACHNEATVLDTFKALLLLKNLQT